MKTNFHIAGAAGAVLMGAMLAGCNPATSAKPAADTGKIADAVKADVAQSVADFNAHDAAKASSHDGPDFVGMFHGAPNTVGAAQDLAATKQVFSTNPNAHVVDTPANVDVAASGDMAVYRSTYVYNWTDPKTKKPVTETGNFLAGYKLQPDGSWKMAWSIVADAPAPSPTPGAKS